MNILIVEDDPYVCRDIAGKLKDLGYSRLSMVSSYDTALKAIEEKAPNLAILDIDLGEEKDGIDVGVFLNTQGIPFIYLSDMQDTTTLERALQTHPVANLDKPVSSISLRNAMAIGLSKSTSVQKTPKYAVVSSQSKKMTIDLNRICYLKADKNYCDIYFDCPDGERIVSSTPLGTVLEALKLDNLCQVHRSYAVNLEKVVAFQGNRVFMDRDFKIEIPISPTYLLNFKARFKAI